MPLGADTLNDADLPESAQVQPPVIPHVAALHDPQHPRALPHPGPPAQTGPRPLVHFGELPQLHVAV